MRGPQPPSLQGGRPPVKEGGRRDDRILVSEILPADRRAAAAAQRTVSRRGPRRLLAALRDGLYRPLAGDDDRVAYWIRHIRNGVLLTEVSAWSVVGYVFVTHSPGRHNATLLAMAGLAIVACPGLLLLPLEAMMRDRRGPTMFYLWSIATTVLVIIGTRIDGGPSSPLDALMFLTLTFMTVAYSPYGVVAMGSVMTIGYLF